VYSKAFVFQRYVNGQREKDDGRQTGHALHTKFEMTRVWLILCVVSTVLAAVQCVGKVLRQSGTVVVYTYIVLKTQHWIYRLCIPLYDLSVLTTRRRSTGSTTLSRLVPHRHHGGPLVFALHFNDGIFRPFLLFSDTKPCHGSDDVITRTVNVSSLCVV